jgi:hypothetical protein
VPVPAEASALLAFLIKKHQWFQVLVFTAPSTAPTSWPNTWQARHPVRGDPRQQEPVGPHPRAGRLQGRQAAGAGGHRHRRPRPRHRPAAAGGQLRAAQRPEDYVHRIGRTGRAGSSGAPCRWSTASCRC